MAFDARASGSMSQINVTPLVDVMLVLLVIFMVTAPILQQGVAVDLPEVATGALPTDNQPPILVSLDAKGRFYVDDDPIELENLAGAVAAARKEGLGGVVLVRADRAVPYGQVMELMAELRAAGIEHVGLVTEPAAGEQPARQAP